VKLKLLCQDPLASPRELTLDRFPIELGRGEAAGVRIDDRWLSRRHCELREEAGTIVIRDLNSRHGTFINGQPVGESPLRPGDELCIGLSHFIAVYLGETAAIHDSSELALA
jgi:pSer/pThr/pTyr-binding forkhead associated (FHA) protein